MCLGSDVSLVYSEGGTSTKTIKKGQIVVRDRNDRAQPVVLFVEKCVVRPHDDVAEDALTGGCPVDPFNP